MKTEEQKWRYCVVEDFKMLRERIRKLEAEVIILVLVTIMSLIFSIVGISK